MAAEARDGGDCSCSEPAAAAAEGAAERGRRPSAGQAAATRIQRLFRGYRTRRSMAGMTLAAGRWRELAGFAASEASFKDGQAQRAGGARPQHASAAKQWQRIRRHLLPLVCERGLLLQQEHWLEVVDRKHRYGSNLRVYYEYWLSLPPCEHDAEQSFFHWLEGAGQHVDLPECPRAILETSTVQYLTREEVAQYEVEVDKSGLLRYRAGGGLVDTGDAAPGAIPGVPGYTLGRDGTPTPGEQQQQGVGESVQQQQQQQGSREAQQQQQQQQGTGGAPPLPDEEQQPSNAGSEPAKPKDAFIYVMDTDEQLFVARKVRGRFHHSSFLQGSPLISAGGIRVHRGALQRITAMSGHYKPSQADIDQLVLGLARQGVDMSRVVVVRQVKAAKGAKTAYCVQGQQQMQQEEREQEQVHSGGEDEQREQQQEHLTEEEQHQEQ